MLRILTIVLFLFSFSSADSFAEPSLNVEQVIEGKSVPTGKEIKGKLVLKNKGDELLEERRINPGNVIDLNFVVDTRGKLGMVEKTITIHSNDPDSPWKEVVTFHALPSGMEGADTQAIFTPACSSCHIDNGVNKKNEELYQAVCAMCHPTVKFNSRGETLTEMITKGQKLIAMPAFGGHLSEDQIKSLVEYIEGQKE
jgi:cytochrome c553